jgi:dihydrolipoamide dehydrogenase
MDFDLTIIGSGPGGYKAAITAAHLGARVAIIERSLPGGTCLNQGCIPKKTLLYLAGMIEDVNALNGRGLIGQVQGDFAAAMRHKDEVVASIRENFPVWLRRLGIKLFSGHGRLLDRHRVRVDGTDANEGYDEFTTEKVIIATGAEPIEHPACPTDGTRVLSSRDFMFRMTDLPGSILCLGGGAIGSELGFLLNQFGTKVTVVESADRLLNRSSIPERASAILERKFKRLGIEVRKGITVDASHVGPDDVKVVFSDGSTDRYARVLVAIGRRPATAHLGLEAAGVETDGAGFIPVSKFSETNVSGIYAIGDVVDGPMTANAALHDAKVAAINAVNGNQMKHNYYRVPIVIDSALEIAAVGLTDEQADEAGFEPDVARANFAGSAKARGRLDTEGFIEVVHDEETGQLLGGCIVGPEAGEQIHMLSAACHSQRGLWFFTDMNYSHPSWCEELENAIDPYTSAFSQSGREVFRPGIFASSAEKD